MAAAMPVLTPEVGPAASDKILGVPTMKSASRNEEATQISTPPASDEASNSHKDDDAASSSSLSDLDDMDLDEDNKFEEAARAGAEAEQYSEVKPDHYEDNIPIFKPTMEQFKDFERYVKGVDPYGMQSGIVLIDPPEEWKQKRKALDELVKTIKIKNPLTQEFHGAQGVFTQRNMEKQRSYNLPQWKAICESTENQPPAKRGEKRLNADKLLGRGTTKTKKPEGSPIPNGAKRSAGRPRVKPLKEEIKEEADSSLLAPPTPTSPETKPASLLESVESDAEDTTGSTPAKGKRGKKPAAKPGPKPKWRQPKSAGRRDSERGGGKGTETSVAARRLRRAGEATDEFDEEAFEGFDYRVYDNDQWTKERCSELEEKYWKSLNFSNPMYAADMPGSLFDQETTEWNVAKLPNLLDLLGQPIPGVNTAYLYMGMWKATFAWHLEDVDLYSINYIHFGAPKQWYSISQKDAPKFENAMKSIWGQDAKSCDQFLRHKTYLVSPALLKSKYGVTVNKVVHREGQFVITFPIGYHSGYNLGYNCAESVNFAIENWLNYGKTAKKCQCEADSVFIDVDWFIRRMNGEPTPEYEEVYVTDDEDDMEEPMDLPTPPGSERGKIKTQKRKRGVKDLGPNKKAKKLIKIRKISKNQPCCLCPNDFAWEDLLPTTTPGQKAHRRCAMYTPETYIASRDGKEQVFNVENIGKDRLDLKCSECRFKKGSCFQCSSAKCTRAYHATCAWHAGVQVDVGEIAIWHEGVEYRDLGFDWRCKLHRTVKKSRPHSDLAFTNHLTTQCQSREFQDHLANLKPGSLVQWQVTHSDEIQGGIVVESFDATRDSLVVKVLPEQKIVREVDASSLLFVDSATSCLQRPSDGALDLPEELQGKTAAIPDGSERKPALDDPFTEGSEHKWAEFSSSKIPYNNTQKAVDLSKEKRLWHYLGEIATELKPQYSADLTKRVHDPASVFYVEPPKRQVMAPPPQPRRQSLAASYPMVNVAARNAAMYNVRQQMLERQYRESLKLPIAPSAGSGLSDKQPIYPWNHTASQQQYRPLQARGDHSNISGMNSQPNQASPTNYQQILNRQQLKAEQLDLQERPFSTSLSSIGIDQQAVDRQRLFQQQATQQSRNLGDWSAGRTLPPLMKYGALAEYAPLDPNRNGQPQQMGSRHQPVTFTTNWMSAGNDPERPSFGPPATSPMMPQMIRSPSMSAQSPTLQNGTPFLQYGPNVNGSYTQNDQMIPHSDRTSGNPRIHADISRPGSSGVVSNTPPMIGAVHQRRVSNPAYPFKSPERLKAQKEAEKNSPPGSQAPFPLRSPRVKTEHGYSRPSSSSSLVDPQNPPQFIDPNMTQITPPSTSHGRSRHSSMSQIGMHMQMKMQTPPPMHDDGMQFINVNHPQIQPNPLKIEPMSAQLVQTLTPRPMLPNGQPMNDRPIPTVWTDWQQQGGFWGDVARYFVDRHAAGVNVYCSPYKQTESSENNALAGSFYASLSDEKRSIIDAARKQEQDGV